MFVQRVDRTRGGDVLKNIKAIPEVTACDVMSGDLDLLVGIETAHAERLKEIENLIAKLPGVRDTVTSMVLGQIGLDPPALFPAISKRRSPTSYRSVIAVSFVHYALMGAPRAPSHRKSWL
jgi:hypothetical protein